MMAHEPVDKIADPTKVGEPRQLADVPDDLRIGPVMTIEEVWDRFNASLDALPIKEAFFQAMDRVEIRLDKAQLLEALSDEVLIAEVRRRNLLPIAGFAQLRAAEALARHVLDHPMAEPDINWQLARDVLRETDRIERMWRHGFERDNRE